METEKSLKPQNAYVEEKEKLIENLGGLGNQAFIRLAKNLVDIADETRDYSRMHHRHARSHTRR